MFNPDLSVSERGEGTKGNHEKTKQTEILLTNGYRYTTIKQMSINNQREKIYSISYWSKSWRPYLLLIIVCGVIFGKAIWFDYTYFDDDFLILKSYEPISDLSQIGQAFKNLYLGPYYRPIITISLILDAQISEVSPWMYHLSNTIFHLIAAILVFLLLLRLKSSKQIAMLASIIFIVHPLATQTVVWIPGRNDSLLAIFSLLSVITFLQFVTKNRWYILIGHFISLMFALLTKETAIILPILILIYLFMFERDFIFRKDTILVLIGWILIMVVWYLLRSSALTQEHSRQDTYSMSAFTSNIRIILEMFGKMVIPVGLSSYSTYSDGPMFMGIAILLGIGILVIWSEGLVKKLIIFAIIWIVSFTLPTLVVRLFESEHRFAYLENRFYTSIIGFSIFLSAIFRNGTAVLNRFRNVIFPIIVLIYGTITFSYSENFKDSLAHWKHAIKMSPKSADAYFNMGIVFSDVANDLNSAIENYKKAIALNPNNHQYHNNLGILYGRKRNLSQAEAEFQTAIQLNKSDPLPLSNLGYVYYLNHNLIGAEKYWLKALSLDSNFVEVNKKLMDLNLLQNNLGQARYYYGRLLKLGVTVDSAILTNK